MENAMTRSGRRETHRGERSGTGDSAGLGDVEGDGDSGTHGRKEGEQHVEHDEVNSTVVEERRSAAEWAMESFGGVFSEIRQDEGETGDIILGLQNRRTGQDF